MRALVFRLACFRIYLSYSIDFDSSAFSLSLPGGLNEKESKSRGGIAKRTVYTATQKSARKPYQKSGISYSS